MRRLHIAREYSNTFDSASQRDSNQQLPQIDLLTRKTDAKAKYILQRARNNLSDIDAVIGEYLNILKNETFKDSKHAYELL